MPILSIIVPVFNAGNYLDVLIDSIIKQSCSDWELILVDDGSIDESSTVCDMFSKYDERIRTIHCINCGQSRARNIGLDVAAGDYITFADHDDYVHREAYTSIIRGMKTHGVDVGASSFCHFSDDIQKIDKISSQQYGKVEMLTQKEWLLDCLKPSWKTPVWNKIYAKRIIKDIRFDERFHLGEDNKFSYEVIKKADKVIYIDYPFYMQRMHDNNFEFSIQYYDELLIAKETLLHDIKNNYSHKIYQYVYVQFIDDCVRIYNEFYRQNDEKRKKKSMRILIRNLDNLLTSSLSIRRKLRLFCIKYDRKRLEKDIVF